MSDTASSASLLPDLDSDTARRYRSWRHIVDVTTRYLMAFGGISVIIAIVLIAFYLFYVVLPMFKAAHVEQLDAYPLPGNSAAPSLYYAMEEQREVGLRLDAKGELNF
ncbi:MAG: phosphate ABC transporter permease, partial [Thiotrichales bacterium]|nr:phosphate ABC transporter permease [Thiotrichales bacterium]